MEFGETADVSGAWDKTQLSFAQMNAPGPIQLASIDLSTGAATPSGRTATLGSLAWTGTGDKVVYGNDGPVNEEGGLSRHVVTRCELLNAHAHQKLRPAEVTPLALSIDGAPVIAPYHPDPAGFVINHWFHYVHVSKSCE